MRQTGIDCSENHDADSELWDVLLILESLVGREQHVERLGRASQQLAIEDRRPPFFLNGADFEVDQIAPKLPRHVFIEQHPPHAICANAARPAASRNATACSRVTLGKLSRNSSRLS